MNNFKLTITTDTQTTEVTQPEVENLTGEEKLNKLATKYLSGNLPISGVLYGFNADAPTGVTVIPENDDAFVLNRAVVGNIRAPDSVVGPPRTQINPTRTGPVAINTALISYSAAYRMSEGYGTVEGERNFVLKMAGLINNAVLQFMQELGVDYVRSCKMRCERPGINAVIFRDMDDTAAFEIRFTLYKE